MDLAAARAFTEHAMPGLLEAHARLVGHASVAFPGYPAEPMHAIGEDLVALFRASGVPQAELVEVPGDFPALYAVVPGPAGSPTVTLYAHYDVQPAPAEQGWTVDPWTATVGPDGRIYGRGTADCKAGVVAIAGTMAAFDGAPPCTVRILIEGAEETFSHIEDYIEAHPQDFASDAFVICDSGPDRVGEPALTSGLRGDVAMTVTLRTLDSALHSGQFGGGAPDALVEAIRLFAAMYDADGNTAIPGLASFDWPGGDVDEASFRASAGVVGDVRLPGTGPLASRLWSRPSATVIGMDVPTVAGSSNALVPVVRARLSVRIAAGADAATELATVQDFLRAHAPDGLELEFSDVKEAASFLAAGDGPIVGRALSALQEAYGAPATRLGSGGSIPLVATLLSVSPDAEAVIWGPEDGEKARIHGPDESVDPAEIERIMVAQIRLLTMLGEADRS